MSAALKCHVAPLPIGVGSPWVIEAGNIFVFAPKPVKRHQPCEIPITAVAPQLKKTHSIHLRSSVKMCNA